MQRKAFVVKVEGEVFLGTKRQGWRVPFERARIFQRRCDAGNADKPTGSEVLEVAVILKDA